MKNRTPKLSRKLCSTTPSVTKSINRSAFCRVVKLTVYAFTVWVIAQTVSSSVVLGQVLTGVPVVGGATASTANVFVRTDQPASVGLRYSADPNLESFLISQTFQTSSENDFTKIIPLANLVAETTYYLSVTINGVPQSVSPYPSFTTFPPSGSSRNFNFVVLTDFRSVNKLNRTVQTFASAASENPVFAFIGGDFDHTNPQTLANKRRMFRDLYNANTPYMGDFVNLILRKIPIVHQWDDHDSGMNNSDKNYPDWNLSQQVFQEYVPSYPLPSVTPGTWQKFSYAQVDCFVLDNRSQRDPGADPDDANKSMLDGNNLGSAGELQWLENGLLTSTAQWKIIFTSVITNTTTKQNDAWGAYQTEWNALKNFINTNNIRGVVFISGDLHLGAIDNGTQAGFPEMCVEAPNGGDGLCPTAAHGTWSEGYYDDTTCSGYGLVTISENPAQLILQAMDEFGNLRVSYSLSPPCIMTQPTNKTVRVGRKAKFSVIATGNPAVQYQWTKNGVNIAGATNTSYTTPPTTPADNGSLFAVTLTNSSGIVTSNSAMLTAH
jgi:alkaline phosphatase D